MKKILAIGMIVMAIFAFGCGRNQQFGVVDMQKVQTDSEVFKNATKELQEKGKAMEDELTKETEGKSEEKEKNLYGKSAKIRTFQAEQQNKVKSSFEAAAAQVAKEKNLGAILVKEAVPQGGVDVTEDIIKAMK